MMLLFLLVRVRFTDRYARRSHESSSHGGQPDPHPRLA